MSYIPLPLPGRLDILSCLKFSPSDDILLASAYDKTVLIYSCQSADGQIAPRLAAELKAPTPVLCTTFAKTATYVGLLDGTVRQVDYENMRFANMAPAVTSGINNIQLISENLLVASSFDGMLSYIDPRMQRPVFKHATGGKVLAMDTTSQYVTLGMSNRQIEIYDLRNRETPWQTRASGLKYQITALRNFNSGDGFALASVDGRVSIEYYNLLPESQALKFAFKCHRLSDKAANVDTVHPVSQLLFHKHYNTLFTSGGDGHVCVWNWQRRKRMKQFAQIADPKSISHMDMNRDGSILAVGASDDRYLRREDLDVPFEASSSKIHLRSLTESECKPKN